MIFKKYQYICVMDTQLKEEQKFLLRLDRDLKEEASMKAKKQNRSLNGYIVTLIEEDLKEKKK